MTNKTEMIFDGRVNAYRELLIFMQLTYSFLFLISLRNGLFQILLYILQTVMEISGVTINQRFRSVTAHSLNPPPDHHEPSCFILKNAF